jgi:SAM-dependent methyltransferase
MVLLVPTIENDCQGCAAALPRLREAGEALRRHEAESAITRHCPVCGMGESETLERFSTHPWDIVRCNSCEMVYLANPPPSEAVMFEFDWEQRKSNERNRRRRQMGRVYYFVSDGMKRLRAFFRSFAPRKEIRYIMRHAEGLHILDVGCGGGQYLAQLPGEYVPHGIEPSPGLHAVADAAFRKREGYCIHNVAHVGFGELPANMGFDLVLMRSFLEHDVMVEQTLLECHKRLAPRGKLLIKVPNIACWNARLRGANWPGIRNPDHVNYFTPKSLRLMLNRCGYSSVSIPLHWRLPSSDNVWAVAHR